MRSALKVLTSGVGQSVGLVDGSADGCVDGCALKIVPMQLPLPLQTSFTVSGSPSSHFVPIGANGSEHTPLLQVPAIWHCEIGVHVTGSQRSFSIHWKF